MRINVELNGAMIPVELSYNNIRSVIDEELNTAVLDIIEEYRRNLDSDDEITDEEFESIYEDFKGLVCGITLNDYRALDFQTIFRNKVDEVIDARPKAKVFEVIVSYRCEFTKRVKAMSREEAENFLDNADLDYLGESRSMDVEWEDYDTYEDDYDDDDYDFDATRGY